MKKRYIKMWGEHISIKGFFLGLIFSIALIVIALIIAPKGSELLFGLVSIIIAFIINIIFIKPKRNINVKEIKNDN